MHSCELAAPPPPAQGAALLLELGTLIIESRSSKAPSYGSKGCQAECQEAVGGASSKRLAVGSPRSSPAKRNRDQARTDEEHEDGATQENVASNGGPATAYNLKARMAKAAPLRWRAEALWRDRAPLCIEVLLAPTCDACREPLLLLERWTLSVYSQRSRGGVGSITSQWLLNAVRSQLHFSQISAWSAKLKRDAGERLARARRELSPSERRRKLSRETCNYKKYESNCDEDVLKADADRSSPEKDGVENLNVVYELRAPSESPKSSSFLRSPSKHVFPLTDIGGDVYLEVVLESLPRLEDVPAVRCACSVPERRKSRDASSSESPSGDALAKKLAVSCSLAEPEPPDEDGPFDPGAGCSGMVLRPPDLNDSGVSGCCKSRDASPAATSVNEASYRLRFAPVYPVVDDRMQTSCKQKGKHRCNCDDESDQGVRETAVVYSTTDEKKIRDPSKQHHRRHRKEAKQRLPEPVDSRRDRKHSLVDRKARTCSSSDNSDGRSSPELVRYGALCHDCRNCTRGPRNGCPFENPVRCGKQPESGATTSIPILQASKFDHVNRFGGFRSAKSLHGPLTLREFYSLKRQQSVRLDGAGSLREAPSNDADDVTLRTESVASAEICPCEVRLDASPKGFRFDDDVDYRPSTKKLISSYTQTDDMQCGCGKSLVPVCSDCGDPPRTDFSRSSPGVFAMKRSTANHNLADVDKSALFLEAMERTSRKCGVEREDRELGSVEFAADAEVGSNGRVKVIDLHCDNSISKLNNCECDNNIVYSNSYKKRSGAKDSLSRRKSLFRCSDRRETKCNSYGDKENSLTESDLSILMSDDAAERVVRRSEPDPEDSLENFIRKPKLKRFASPLDRLDKIISDRNMKKNREKCSENSNIDSFYRNGKPLSEIETPDKKKRTKTQNENGYIHIAADEREEDNVVVYEKGDYGTFGHIIECDRTKSMPIVCNQSNSVPISEHSAVPSVSEMDKFRYRLDSAASMVFHSHTGLPLTSSPAPLRRGKSCFDYDSSINSVSSIKSALYGLSASDLETLDQNPTWSPGSSPGSPSHIQTEPPSFNNLLSKTVSSSIIAPNRRNKFRHGTSSGLLGSFEESVLNGRLEPAATVAGFTAEIGASGEFCPSHIKLPVTVFFYTLGDNTTSSPYLGHINLGRKGYCVPRAGTIQVTLFNPHGTVVKMFVVMYDLEDMPPYSRTFLRQRTLWGGTCLRYLIHLRFLTSKSGKVYLHTDIRIIVSRKADIDTAAAHSLASGVRLNAFTESINNNNNNELGKKKGCKVERGTFERRSRKDQFIMEKQKLNCTNGLYELNDANHNVNRIDHIKIKKHVNLHDNMSTVISKELSYELRSYTYGPDNPKYSPR